MLLLGGQFLAGAFVGTWACGGGGGDLRLRRCRSRCRLRLGL